MSRARDAFRELAKRELARRRLLDFTRYTFPHYEVNWHHAVIAHQLDRVASGECKRLMIFAPPGHGKSELCSRRFPAYMLGRDPSTRLLCTSHGSSLAEGFGSDVQRIMEEPNYARVFGKPLAGKRTALHFETVQLESFHRPGYYFGTGARGSITGRRFDIAIIDDPVKGREEAESPTIREKLWAWYEDDLLTRAAGPDSAIVFIMTRWHEDDLAGRILQRMAAGGLDKWTVVWLPAMREVDEPYPVPVVQDIDPRAVGEPLWERVAPLVQLEEIKRTNPRKHTSLYQQRPVPAEGGMFQRSWARSWEPCTIHGKPGVAWTGDDGVHRRYTVASLRRFHTVDSAVSEKEKACYSAMLTWGQATDGTLLLLDIPIRERLEQPKLIPAIRVALVSSGVYELWVESNGVGKALIQHLRAAGVGVRELDAGSTDKRVRAWDATAAMEAGRVRFQVAAHWLSDFETELYSFPEGANDDQVDCFAYAAQIATGKRVRTPPRSSLPPKRSGLDPRGHLVGG